MKNLFIFGGLSLLLLVGGVWWSNIAQERQLLEKEVRSNADDIVSRTGLHAHSKLEIYVNGEKQPIPRNIGVGPQYFTAPTYEAGMRMTAVHTHEPDGTIHLEFQNIVTKDDMRLKNFFAIWGKEFMSFGNSVTMTVNGEDNTELDSYQMRDDDKIELRYE